MKVKNSYLKLMLWTLSGAAIGAVLGAGSIMFAKRGAASLAELLYAGADSLAGTGRLLSGFDEQGEEVVPPLWIPMRKA